MLVSFSWQGYLDFSLFTVGFAEDAHARHSSNKFDSALAQPHLSLFTLHFSFQQLTWYRLNYLTTDYLTTSEPLARQSQT